jgi:hypothetical protein
MNGQQMKVYMLTVYIIHVECDDIMLNHHLLVDVAYNLTCATNGILVVHFGCNLILIANYSRKLRLSSNDYIYDDYIHSLIYILLCQKINGNIFH